MIENHTDRENMEIREIFLHLKYSLGMEFTACEVELMLEETLTLFTACDAYRYFVGQV